jgi:hypothetical protein
MIATVAQPDREFTTTHWSVVLAAGQCDSPDAQQALGKLCRTYWYPLYAFARRQGRNPEDAEDLTQGFFARFLENGSVGLNAICPRGFSSPDDGKRQTKA